MNEPREPVTPEQWQEVQRAYREAPPPAPSAGLDARVRAAVEAELAASSAAPAQSAKVIEFPRWRRVAVPLATAVTIIVAIGVAWLERTNTSGTPVLVTSAPTPEAKDSPADSARTADATNGAGLRQKEEQQKGLQSQESLQARVERKAVAERSAAMQLDMPHPVAAPPPALAPPPPPAIAPAPAAEPAAASDRLMAAKPATAQRSEQRVAGSAATANGAFAEVAPASPPPTLAQVRQLLRDGQHEAARTVFKRWREAHAAEAVPDDLKALAAEAAR